MIEDSELLNRVAQRAEVLDRERKIWEPEWQAVADYMAPRKADITSETNVHDSSRYAAIFDTTGIRAARVHAAGEMGWMTPIDSDWFGLAPPAPNDDIDEFKAWYSATAEAVALVLAKSNFYSEFHEALLDRCVFGTVGVLVEETGSMSRPVRFETLPIGRYSIAAGPQDTIDTVILDRHLPARVAAELWGADKLSDAVRAMLDDPGRMDEEVRFRHAIYPRPPDEFPKDTPKVPTGRHMPIASVVWESENNHLVGVSGFWEHPILVGRYLKWADGDYGVGPGVEALPDVRLANEMAKDILRAAEVAIYPRILLPPNFEGAVDFRPHGKTYADDLTNPPRAWLESDVDMRPITEELAERRRNIQDAFGVPHFRMFADLDKQMTATEVLERRAERLNAFTPAFHRLTTEILAPLINRVFAILVRASAPAWGRGEDSLLPVPPEGLSAAGGSVPMPKVDFLGVVAMADREREVSSILRTWEILSPLNETAPEWIDNFDIDKTARLVARNSGVTEEVIAPSIQVQQIRQARAQAAQEAAQQGPPA